MKKIIFILLLNVSLLFGEIGKITGVKGEASVKRASQILVANVGFGLEKNDEISTKDKSKVLVLFQDGTSVTVGKSSTMRVNEYIQDAMTPQNNKANIGFGQGVFRTITGKIGKSNPDGFKLETKSASLGIRGSDGTTLVNENGNVKHTTNSGGFYIVNKATGQSFEIPKGTTATFEAGKEIKVETTTQADIDEGGEVHEDVPAEVIKEDDKKEEKEKLKEEKKEEQKTEEKNEKIKDEANKDSEIVGGDENRLPINTSTNGNILSLEPLVENNLDSLEVELPNIDELPVVNVEDIIDEADTKDETVELPIDETPEEVTPISDIAAYTPQGILSDLMVDLSTLTKEIVGSDTYNNTNILEYGYILENTQKIATYITGVPSPSVVIEQYILTQQTANYSGNIASFVNGVASGGTINLNMNFGTKNLTGTLNVTEGNWKANINSGTISPYGFSSSNISSASGSSVSSITGNLSGKYYGSNASSVGGNFNLTSGGNSVNGVFGGAKQ